MARMDRMAQDTRILNQWLTVSEVADRLGVSATCVLANYIKGGEGQLRAVKRAGRWHVHTDDLREFRRLKRPHGTNLRYRN